jgi:hypothetical protein
MPRIVIGPPGSILDWDNWGKPVTDAINEFDVTISRRIIARGQRATTSTTTTTVVGVLRLDDISVVANMLYVVRANVHLNSTVNNDTVRASVRYTEDGSTPGTGSTVLGGASAQTATSTSSVKTHAISTFYKPNNNLALSLLLTCERIAGTGNASLFADGTFLTDLWLELYGTDPGNTGTII